MEFTFLMPCLNESETLEFAINEAVNAIERLKLDAEILIADNGSVDNSAEIAIKNGARVTNVKMKGYGSALIGGIKAAKGKYIIMGDCDGSYDFAHPDLFVQELRRGAKLVMGDVSKAELKKAQCLSATNGVSRFFRHLHGGGLRQTSVIFIADCAALTEMLL